MTAADAKLDDARERLQAEVVDAEIVSTAIVPSPPPALFKTEDPVEVVEKAAAVADALKNVLDRQKLTSTIQGRKFVKVEGWTLLGSMLGISAVCTGTETVPDGFRATVEARTTDGRVVGAADSLCTRKEKTWKTRDDYALLSMAQTRATSKALRIPLGFVVTLAGYEATPAEEMPSEPSEQPTTVKPKDGDRPLNDEELKAMRAAIRDSGLHEALVLSSVGVEDVVMLSHARAIRAKLDAGVSGK